MGYSGGSGWGEAMKAKKQTDEKAYDEFVDIIRNRLSDEQFWKWVSGWKDAEAIIEDALDWDMGTIRDELPKLRKMRKVKK